MIKYIQSILCITLYIVYVLYDSIWTVDATIDINYNIDQITHNSNTIQSIDLHLISITSHTSLRSILSELRTYTFYRIFAVNLYSDCKYWSDSHQCAEIGCAVCGECSADELPVEWLNEVSAHTSQVNHTIDNTIQTWSESERYLWIYQDNSSINDIKYIDISYNPEGYTGYVGEAAHKIWSAIYLENCFVLDTVYDSDQQCYERKVFYKLISGMHSTISAHIAWNWPTHIHYIDTKYTTESNMYDTHMYSHHTIFDTHDSSAVSTSPNIDVYIDKLGLYTDRIDNLRFTYTVLLRAVNKATPMLLQYDYITGNHTEELLVKHTMSQLLSNDAIEQCSSEVKFDEKSMFNGNNRLQLKQEFQEHFRNVSAIIDCVGCEKCRLHGKLQVLGIGTALRILFDQPAELQRNEIMSLIVTLSKVADALYYVQILQQMVTNTSDRTTPSHITSNNNILYPTALNTTSDPFIESHSTTDAQLLGTAVMVSFTLFSIIITYIYSRY